MGEKLLIAGPWVGEFGWELFAWQAYIRALSRHYDTTVVICRESSQPLYADFADAFLPTPDLTGLADSFFMHGVDTGDTLRKILQANPNYLRQGTTLVPPRRLGMPPFTPCTQDEKFGDKQVTPEYITFGTPGDLTHDYIFHVRNRQLRRDDNWNIENWEKLRDKLQDSGASIACIGTLSEASHIPGTTDLRGTNLLEVFDVVRNSKCVFGPSSGPMHLASLCGARHVVWSKDGNRQRYMETWNPHNTPVLFLSRYSWHPTPEYVFEQFDKWREEWKL